MSWAMPIVSAIAGGVLLARLEIKSQVLAWYLGLTATAIAAWVSFCLVSLFLLRTAFVARG